MHVLVIDDNRDSTDTMVELLQLLGHQAHGHTASRKRWRSSADSRLKSRCWT